MAELTVPDDLVPRAKAALERNAWRESFDVFAQADAEGLLSSRDLMLYAEAANWCGQVPRTLELHERAYASFSAKSDAEGAARAAMMLAETHTHTREGAVANSWLRRAEKLLEPIAECPAHSRLAWMKSMFAQARSDLDTALAFASESLAIGERCKDRESQALGLLRKGRVLIKQGHVDEGMLLVDEAMVAAVGGELSPMATGTVYCATIAACHDLFDYNRAGEWTDAARRWCERSSVTGFPGICRVHRAEILRLRGNWQEAQTEAVRAQDELRAFGALDLLGDSFYELGEIRLRMGELEAAREAFRQAHELGRDPQPGLALLWLEEGRAHAAASQIAQAVADVPASDRLRRARLLPAQVEIAIAAGDLATARSAADELDADLKDFTSPGLSAATLHARGAVQLANGDGGSAVVSLRKAIQLWKQIDAPYEAARSRTLLAEARRSQGDDEAARLELQSARASFEKLGAAVALRRTEQPASAGKAPDTPSRAGTLAATMLAPPGTNAMPTVGDVIDGKIELLRLLGGGGMGMVFEALNRRTGRHVAVKLLRRDLCSDGAACQRLLQEALACGRIQHPNVVDVYDAGTHGSTPYIVMELLRGESLGQRLDRERTLSVSDAAFIVLQAAAGLGAAHRAGIVHRDLKPDNLFLAATPGAERGYVVKVVDFGISKLADSEARLADTQTGTIVGTPYYMSPEQAMGSKLIDRRTDFYALGAVLFHALTGRTPFQGDNYNALLAAILTTPMVSPRSLRADIPVAVEAAIVRATARDPDLRPGTADEFAADLRSALG